MCTWSPPASIHSSKEKLKVIRRLNNAIFQTPDHCLRPDFWLLSHFVLYIFSLGSFVLQCLDDKDVEEERKCPLFSGQNTIVSAESTWERLWQEPVSIHEGNNKGMNRERRDQSQSQFSPRQRQEGIKTWDAAGRVLSLTSFQDTPGFHSDVRKSQTVTWTLVNSCFKCRLETAALTLFGKDKSGITFIKLISHKVHTVCTFLLYGFKIVLTTANTLFVFFKW